MSDARLREPYFDLPRQAVITDVDSDDGRVFMGQVSREILVDRFGAGSNANELLAAYAKHKEEIDTALVKAFKAHTPRTSLNFSDFE
jgi:hypothetical protein